MTAQDNGWLVYVASDDEPSGERYYGMTETFARADAWCARLNMRDGVRAYMRPYSYVVRSGT